MNAVERILDFLGNDALLESSKLVVKFVKLDPEAKAPFKANPTDAGWDLSCVGKPEFDDDGNMVYRTGLALEIPEGYVGLLFPRSSIAKKDLLLTNSVGVIDCHYRGEVLAKFKSFIPEFSKHIARQIYESGDRICQLIVMPIPQVEMEEVSELSETDRGSGGYGSSGR